MKYQGKYKPKNPEKYSGNINDITFRSSWEKAMLLWCDTNPDVVSYSSEEMVVPYFYDVDKKMHRYYVDFVILLKNGKKIAIEIKPKKETKAPRKNKNQQRYLQESLTYVKNQNKWVAAKRYCENRGIEFQVWTEDTLKNMGILKKDIKKIKPLKSRKKK